MADLKVALEDVRDESDSQGVTAPPASAPARCGNGARSRSQRLPQSERWRSAAWWRATRTQPEGGPSPFLTRLTSDVGWTDDPAISLDGKFLAYASDRSGDDNLDIWVQQIPDGPPVRLTRDTADEVEPSFSADGSRIAFQSSRLGGGVYIIPTLGGEERLLAARGFSPRFSPDGRWIAYGVAEPTGSRHRSGSSRRRPGRLDCQRLLPGSGTGLVPRRPTSAVLGAAPPRRAAGKQHRLVRDGDSRRVARPDRSARGVTSREISGVSGTAVAGCVGPRLETAFCFMAASATPRTCGRWRSLLGVGRVSGVPQRATFGTTDEAAASVASDGRMVFISRTMGADIWSLPIDANRGKQEGDLKRVTQDAADDYDPSVSEDGTTLVFRSRRGGSIRHHPEEARDERGDRPDQNARRSLCGTQPRWHEGRVFVSGERQDAHLHRCRLAAEPPKRSATTAVKSRPGRRQVIRSCMSRLGIRQGWAS